MEPHKLLLVGLSLRKSMVGGEEAHGVCSGSRFVLHAGCAHDEEVVSGVEAPDANLVSSHQDGLIAGHGGPGT